MSTQTAIRMRASGDSEMLDADTSAALLRWLETADAPAGIDPEHWERWAEGGCRGHLDADGMPMTRAMLGDWARTGSRR